MRFAVTVLTLATVAQSVATADVLVLRDGRRVVGALTAIRGNTVEFKDEDGRTRRYQRLDIRSIHFDDDETWSDMRAQSAPRQRSVIVEGRTQWTDTGVDVRQGQEVIFAATGQVRWGPGRRHGAAGEGNSPYNASRPIPDASAAALIGKIGPNGDPFLIGDLREALRLRGNGRLFLGVNDDYLLDNSGSLRVVIMY